MRSAHISLLLFCLALVACSSGGGGETSADTAPDLLAEVARGDAMTPDVVADNSVADTAPDHLQPGPEDMLELSAPDIPPDVPEDIVEECPEPGGGPFSVLCQIGCQDDSDCGNKSERCLTFRETGQSFCSVPCQGAELFCPDGFVCYEISEEMLCAPTSGDCNIATAGTDCDGVDLAGVCKYEFPICTSGDWRPGYCTQGCIDDLDCPGAFRRCDISTDPCVPNRCVAVWEDGPQGCGVAVPDANGDGAPCVTEDDCGGDQQCIPAPAVSAAAGVCATPCIQAADCAPESQCAAVAGGDSLCLPAQCQCLATEESPYSTLLETLGLTRCDVLFHNDWLKVFPFALAHDPWRIRRFHEYHDFPASGLAMAQNDVLEFDEYTGLSRVWRSIEKGSALLDRPLPPPAEVAESASFTDAVVAFSTAAGGSPNPGVVEAEFAEVPEELRASLIPIVDAMTGVVLAREEVLAGISADPTLAKYIFDLGHGFVVTPESKYSLSPATPVVYDALTEDFDFAVLYAAARDLARAVDEAGLPIGQQFNGFAARIDTPAGAILIGDSGDDEYDHFDLETKEIALLVDTGGNDTYYIPAGATASMDNLVSVHLDFGGHDYYAYHESDIPENPLMMPDDGSGRYEPSGPIGEDNGPFSFSDNGRQGAGRMGVGLLYDFGEGVDEYRSLRISQGAGVFGVGALYDGGGNDTYMAEALVQGASVFGIGILVDEGGDDFYYSAHVAQGFAYALSFGMLYDETGDDTYDALLGDPELGGLMLYLNPQNPGKSNTSMCQGFGFGRRADFTDGIFMSGGIGLLRDREGQDGYTADIFGLGTGYWFGTGILADGDGDDYYDGRWYVIGAGAHMANGIFIEGGGNDHYNENVPLMNCSVGCGHDFSLGALIDLWGNDIYNSPSLALGAGNADGIGMVWDHEGDDSYIAKANNTLGFANSGDYGEVPGFTMLKCIGLLLDLAGVDSYQRPDMESVVIGNGEVWQNPPAHENLGDIEKGGGIDAD